MLKEVLQMEGNLDGNLNLHNRIRAPEIEIFA